MTETGWPPERARRARARRASLLRTRDESFSLSARELYRIIVLQASDAVVKALEPFALESEDAFIRRAFGATDPDPKKDMPIPVDNVAVVCSTCGATRVGFRFDDAGHKIRVCKKCGSDL